MNKWNCVSLLLSLLLLLLFCCYYFNVSTLSMFERSVAYEYKMQDELVLLCGGPSFQNLYFGSTSKRNKTKNHNYFCRHINQTQIFGLTVHTHQSTKNSRFVRVTNRLPNISTKDLKADAKTATAVCSAEDSEYQKQAQG